MILFLDTADVLGITVIFAGELKSSSPFHDPTATTGDKYATHFGIGGCNAKKVVYPTLFNVVKSAG